MSFLIFTILICSLFCLVIIHLLNSSTPAGDLARQFVRGLIEKIVGHPRESPSDVNPESDSQERRTPG